MWCFVAYVSNQKSFLHGSLSLRLSKANTYRFILKHICIAVVTLIYTRTHNPATCARLTVWLSKNKDNYQKPQLLDEAFKTQMSRGGFYIWSQISPE